MNQTLINIHPSFLSIYISVSIIYLFDQFFKKRKYTAIISILILILICFQIWLSSRAGLLSLIIAGIIYGFLRLKSNLRIYVTIAIFLIIIAIFSIPLTKERFIHAPLRALKSGTGVNPIDQQTWPFTFRLQITNCSIDLLKDFHWLYGYGTGDFRDEMYRCYEKMNYTWLTVRDFDEHNEYFAQIHRLGILGLILLLLVFFYPMRIAYKTKSYLYLSFLIIFSLSCMSENIFSSQKGVVFYAIFNTLLFIKYEYGNSRDKKL
ncbi:MAG: O-antigen ligase family protein [Fulvivirga sp.]